MTVKKKELRRQIAALEQRLEQERTAAQRSTANRENLMDGLARAGLILVTGARTGQDRMRAAKAGVIVLDDLRLIGPPRRTQTADEPSVGRAGAFIGYSAARITDTMHFDVTGDPALLSALGEAIRRKL